MTMIYSRYNYDFSGSNQEINQFNIRFNYKFGKKASQKIGATLQYGGIWNIETLRTGNHVALGIHYEMDFKNFNLKTQFISYNNQPENALGESRDWIQMTAYGFPYNTAAKASLYSIGVAYTMPVKWGPITSIQVYNDYTYMDKAIEAWEDTQIRNAYIE